MAYYRVYVVELEPHGPERYRVRRNHLYVGSTALPPAARLEHHLRGDRASRHVRRHGIRLRPDLAPRRPFLTRSEARIAENRLAKRLARAGYVVWGYCTRRQTPECRM